MGDEKAVLHRNTRGWLEPTGDYLRGFLARPELALLPESCAAERALHADLSQAPLAAVPAGAVAAIEDADARENYGFFLRFRDRLAAAGTLEACYLGLFGQQVIDLPPLFVDLLAEAIVRNLVNADDAFELRAADFLFRSQRIALQEGQVLAGDLDMLDMVSQTAGLGAVGRLLLQANAPVAAVDIEVLSVQTSSRFLASAKTQAGRNRWLLDMGYEKAVHVGYELAHPRAALKALARVLEKWVAHLLGVHVRIKPQQRIDDEAWRWHIGLDTESSALLNDLYEGVEVAPERTQRLLSLFRLEFADALDMRADVAGKPVYLGLAMKPDGALRLKPQNLLLNLPLAKSN